jgi:hypothetical protein
VRQTFRHEPPEAQGTQAPALQTMPEPHPVPFGASASTQAGDPLVQVILPGLHVVPHVAFSVQDKQEPLLQTRLVPQEVPFPTFVVVALQTGLPDAQLCTPILQGFEG